MHENSEHLRSGTQAHLGDGVLRNLYLGQIRHLHLNIEQTVPVCVRLLFSSSQTFPGTVNLQYAVQQPNLARPSNSQALINVFSYGCRQCPAITWPRSSLAHGRGKSWRASI